MGAPGPPKPYKCTGFGDIHGPKPYNFIGFGDINGPKPYKFIGFGDIHGPKPYKFIVFGDPDIVGQSSEILGFRFDAFEVIPPIDWKAVSYPRNGPLKSEWTCTMLLTWVYLTQRFIGGGSFPNSELPRNGLRIGLGG